MHDKSRDPYGTRVFTAHTESILMTYFSKTHLRSWTTLAMVVTLHTAAAAGPTSPLRGTWSFSQFVPSTTLLTGSPMPLTAVGTLVMDAQQRFIGHGVFNTPIEGQQTIELDLDGSCAARGGRSTNGYDCTFNFPAFNLENIRRYCVPMARSHGRCYDEFRCVNIDEPGATVVLAEFVRQRSGTCE